ncbi:unnamed protein product [Tuber melanosporum]|uniref:(Perigord truffle) hypothetical protein n=1 Tax=Tuber melanosporum (strain Mel28) TaxID=656061 RepID=D5GQ23_TUBMM|nr:uncharacterized protein GSTUM_00012160001 [Tuber melanosporum]CAZ86616.1 unnamed protein product [Tuber melanosporum]
MSRYGDDLERRFKQRLGLADGVSLKPWAIVAVLLVVVFGFMLMRYQNTGDGRTRTGCGF